MDKELQVKVCYELGMAFGFIRSILPSVFDLMFGDSFTDEELKLIDKIGSESEELKAGMAYVSKIIDGKGEDDG